MTRHDPALRAAVDDALDRLPLPPVPADETMVDDRNVDWAVKVVNDSGVLAEVEAWTAKRTGRKQTEITVEGILVCLLLLAVEGKPLLLNNVEALAYRRLNVAWRRRFRTAKPTGTLAERRRSYKNVRDQFHRICRSVDPSPNPKNRRLTWEQLREEAERRVADRKPGDPTPEERRRRLRWLSNRLLQATFEMLPRDVRRRWNGTVSIDGTKVPAYAVGRDVEGVWESTDPDAGWHVRSHTIDVHGVPDGTPPPKSSKSAWGYEATIAVMGYDQPLRPPERDDQGRLVRPGDPRPHPNLALGVELHRPATTPGVHAVHVLEGIVDPARPITDDQSALPVGWLGVDRGYSSNSRPEDFHEPVRRLGYRLVMDYKDTELGSRGEADGARMVEGSLYCLSMPDPLVTASVDFRAGRITEAQYRARIAEREAYLFRRKDRLDDNRTRLMCPASGTCPTAACAWKPQSLRRHGLAPVTPSAQHVTLGQRPKACSQTSITVADDMWVKYRQDLRYRSPEWESMYGSLRNTVEGFNGTVKDGNGAALEVASRRRVRGIAPQWLLVLFMLVGENVRRIRRWEQEAAATPEGQPRKSRRASRHQDDRAAWRRERERRLIAGDLPVAPPARTAAQKRKAKERDAEADKLRGHAVDE